MEELQFARRLSITVQTAAAATSNISRHAIHRIRGELERLIQTHRNHSGTYNMSALMEVVCETYCSCVVKSNF